MLADRLGLIQLKGYMGSSEAALFAYEHLDELYKHFRRDYVDRGLELLKEDAGGCTEGISVLEALANLAEENRIGYEVNLRDIPVRQFTIEISELFGFNPFEMKGNIEIKQTSEETEISDEYKTIGYATKKLERIYLRD